MSLVDSTVLVLLFLGLVALAAAMAAGVIMAISSITEDDPLMERVLWFLLWVAILVLVVWAGSRVGSWPWAESFLEAVSGP